MNDVLTLTVDCGFHHYRFSFALTYLYYHSTSQVVNNVL